MPLPRSRNGRRRPPFSVFPALATGRLHLRALAPADLPQLLPISFYGGKQAADLAEAATMQRLIAADYQQGSLIHWGLALRETGELVGTMGFYRGFPAKIGEVGYVLREEFRGRGLAREALAAVVRFGFEKLALAQITAIIDGANRPSVKVVTACGFGLTEAVRADGYLCFALPATAGPAGN